MMNPGHPVLIERLGNSMFERVHPDGARRGVLAMGRYQDTPDDA